MTDNGKKADGADLSAQIGQSVARQGRTLTAFDMVERMRGEFARALPSAVSLDRFMRLAVTELRSTPRLGECSADSLLGALMTAAQLGLEPGGPLGEFYLTPRRLHGTWSVVPIVGYQGLLNLARRAGVGAVDTILVREGDGFEEGANETRGRWFEWRPAVGGDASRPVTHVVTVAHLAGSSRPQWDVLGIDQVEARKARGAAGDSGPWATDREAMIRKTGIRALASRLPQTTELVLARAADEQVQSLEVGHVLAEGAEA